MKTISSSKYLLAISLLTLNCVTAFALPPSNNVLTKEAKQSPIHVTDILTDGKKVEGTATLQLGKGFGFGCHIEHEIGPVKFEYSDVGHFYLNGQALAKEYGLGLTCAIESYTTQSGVTAIAYSLVSDKTQQAYISAEPSRHVIHIK